MTTAKAKPVSFKVSKADRALIDLIVDRAERVAKKYDAPFNRLDATMDITAVHANGTRLDLGRLLGADDFNFQHDVSGIFRHIDRRTGGLRNHFLPRFHSPRPRRGRAALRVSW